MSYWQDALGHYGGGGYRQVLGQRDDNLNSLDANSSVFWHSTERGSANVQDAWDWDSLSSGLDQYWGGNPPPPPQRPQRPLPRRAQKNTGSRLKFEFQGIVPGDENDPGVGSGACRQEPERRSNYHSTYSGPGPALQSTSAASASTSTLTLPRPHHVQSSAALLAPRPIAAYTSRTNLLPDSFYHHARPTPPVLTPRPSNPCTPTLNFRSASEYERTAHLPQPPVQGVRSVVWDGDLGVLPPDPNWYSFELEGDFGVLPPEPEWHSFKASDFECLAGSTWDEASYNGGGGLTAEAEELIASLEAEFAGKDFPEEAAGKIDLRHDDLESSDVGWHSFKLEGDFGVLPPEPEWHSFKASDFECLAGSTWDEASYNGGGGLTAEAEELIASLEAEFAGKNFPEEAAGKIDLRQDDLESSDVGRAPQETEEVTEEDVSKIDPWHGCNADRGKEQANTIGVQHTLGAADLESPVATAAALPPDDFPPLARSQVVDDPCHEVVDNACQTTYKTTRGDSHHDTGLPVDLQGVDTADISLTAAVGILSDIPEASAGSTSYSQHEDDIEADLAKANFGEAWMRCTWGVGKVRCGKVVRADAASVQRHLELRHSRDLKPRAKDGLVECKGSPIDNKEAQKLHPAELGKHVFEEHLLVDGQLRTCQGCATFAQKPNGTTWCMNCIRSKLSLKEQDEVKYRFRMLKRMRKLAMSSTTTDLPHAVQPN